MLTTKRISRSAALAVALVAGLAGAAHAFDHLELTVLNPVVVDGHPAVTTDVGFSVRVRAVNADGSTDTAADFINAELVSPDVAAALPPRAYLQNGERQFDGVAFLAPGRPVRLRVIDFDDGSVPPAEQLLNVYDPVDHFAITVPAGEKFVGQLVAITVVAEDASGDPVRNFDDDVTLSAAVGHFTTGPTVELVGADFAFGVASLSVAFQGTDPVLRENTLTAVNSVTYGGQPTPPDGSALVSPLRPAGLDNVILLLPGETMTPGVFPGKSGTPFSQISGVPFDGVDVYAIDRFWNPVDVGPYPNIAWTTNDPDPGVVLPAGVSMTTNAELDNSITLVQSGLTYLRVDPTGVGGNYAEAWVQVNPEGLDHFVFDYAVFDTNEVQVTTNPFQIRVRAFDINDNLFQFNGAVSMRVRIGASEESADYLIVDNTTFVNGQLDALVQVTKRAFSARLIIDSNGGVVEQSGDFQVNAGPLDRILFTHPGETWLPGLNDPNFSGNMGVPQTVTAGQVLEWVTLRPVDRFGNLVSGSRTLTLGCPTGYIEVPDYPGNMLTLSSPTDVRVVYRTYQQQILQASVGGIGESYSTPVTVVPDVYDRIVVEAPGEGLEPGIFDTMESDGKLGAAATQDAGVPFNVRVIATDAYWNPISVSDPALPVSVDFSSSDPVAALPASPQALLSSTSQFPVQLITLADPNQQTVRVDDAAGPAFGLAVIPVSAGVIDHFDIGVNAQTNPSPTDILQPIPDHQAGSLLPNVTVIARDSFGNHVTTYTDSVTLQVSHGANVLTPLRISMADGFGNGLYDGVWRGSIRVMKAGADVVLSVREDVYGRGGASDPFDVFAGPYERLNLLLPGETATPGEAPGKIGLPLPATAGDTLTAALQAVDAWWNPVPATPIVHLESADYFEMVSLNNAPLAADGSGAFELFFREATQHSLRAWDLAQPGRNDSSLIDVDAAAYARLMLVAPGETHLPGGPEADGKSGLPDPQIATLQFPVAVRAVDRFWNTVPWSGGAIHLSSDDGSLNATNPVNNDQQLVDGEIIFPLALSTIGYVTMTADDAADPAIQDQQIVIQVQQGAQYEIVTPASALVGPPQAFAMTVRLVDAGGVVMTNAQNAITIRALTPSLQPAGGSLLVGGAQLVDGEVVLGAQAYDTVEAVVLEVSDVSGRHGYSLPITMLSNGVEYVVDVPTTPAPLAGPPAVFPVSVELRDVDTGTLVAEDRDFNIEIRNEAGVVGVGGVGTTLQRLDEGAVTFDQSYTRAENVYVRIWDGTGLTGVSPLFAVRPDGYKRLQIVMPGETVHRGDPAYDATGKSGTPDQQRPAGHFPISVYAVDHHWNVADTTSTGVVHLEASDGSFDLAGNPDSNDSPFVNGSRVVDAFLTQAGPVAVTAGDLANPARTTQTATVNLVDPYYYQITVPATATTGPVPGFAMTIRLIDPLTGYPQPSAFNAITLTALQPDMSTASGSLGVTDVQLVNGVAVIPNQSYDTLEDLVVHIRDDIGRELASDVIRMQTGGLYYAVTLPDSARVGGPGTFPLTIELLDSNTGQRVAQERLVDIELYSAATGVAAAGSFGINRQLIGGGYGEVAQTYTLAEQIYAVVSDSTGIAGTSNTCRMVPDGFKQLQVVAPGETATPGAATPMGKAGEPETQYVGIPFPVEVRAVDQYFNPVTTLNGGSIDLAASVAGWLALADPTEAGAPFINGRRSFTVSLLGAGLVTVHASDSEQPGAAAGTADIPVKNAVYSVLLPDPAEVTTGPPSTFAMTVELVDPEDGALVAAGGDFTMTALKPDWSPALGALGVPGGTLASGRSVINDQTYGVSEDIVIQVDDVHGRTGRSGVLSVVPVGVVYEVVAPDTVVAGESWSMSVRRVDAETGQLVTSDDRTFSVAAVNAWTGAVRPDPTLDPAGLLLYQFGATIDGVAEFPSQSYDRSEVIYLRVTDDEGDDALSRMITVIPAAAAGMDVAIFTDEGAEFSGLMRPGDVVTVAADLVDLGGNPVPGLPVTYSVLGGDGVVGASRQAVSVATTRADGRATVALTATEYAREDIVLTVACGGLETYQAVLPVAGPPETEISYAGVASDYADGVYVTFDTEITLTAATEDPDGIRAIFLDVDGLDGPRPGTAYTGPFTLADLIPEETGLHVLRFFAEEESGVREAVQSVNLYTTQAIDSDKPVTNRPNPFSAGEESTMILFNAPASGPAQLVIYDLYGATVLARSLDVVGGETAQYVWDGRDGEGDVVANGGYICRITGKGYDIRRKIAVVK